MKKFIAFIIALSATPLSILSVNAEKVDYSLWDRFIKYDLRITDYDSLSEEEKDLCKFIFETERSSEDTIICERARRILAGYDVGERIDPEQVENYYNIIDRCEDYWLFTQYPNPYENGYESFREQYEFSKNRATLEAVPDIRHIDEDNCYNEYWTDDERTASIEIYNNSYYTFDEEPFIYKVYDGDTYEKYEIEKNLEFLPTMEYEGCTYQIYPDNTLALYSFNNNIVDSVDIPENIDGMAVTGIKMFAFDQCDIESIHLPETISYIEPFAFYNCEHLCDINFPEGLKSIGDSGFCDCSALGDINIDCPNLEFSKFPFYNCTAKNITVNTKKIPDSVIYSFTEYESLTIGDDVKEVGIYLLNTDTEIPESVKIVTWGEIYEESITVPEHIEILGAYTEPSGNKFLSVSIGGEPKIPLIDNPSMTELHHSIIKGYYNTEAHKYAITNNEQFQALDNLKYGDANNDGNINIADAVSLQKYLFGNGTVGYEADLNKDGTIDSFDMIPMRKTILNPQ